MVPQLTCRGRLPEGLAHLQRRVGFENGAELASTAVTILLLQIALAGLLSRLRDGRECRCRHRLGRVGRRLEWRGPTDAICAYDSRRVGQGRLSSQPFMLLFLLLALHRVGESTLGVGRLRRRSCLAVARGETRRGEARRGAGSKCARVVVKCTGEMGETSQERGKLGRQELSAVRRSMASHHLNNLHPNMNTLVGSCQARACAGDFCRWCPPVQTCGGKACLEMIGRMSNRREVEGFRGRDGGSGN